MYNNIIVNEIFPIPHVLWCFWNSAYISHWQQISVGTQCIFNALESHVGRAAIQDSITGISLPRVYHVVSSVACENSFNPDIWWIRALTCIEHFHAPCILNRDRCSRCRWVGAPPSHPSPQAFNRLVSGKVTWSELDTTPVVLCQAVLSISQQWVY